MFAVFSEMNCLRNLNDLGVYPDEFYTDFDALKTRATYFRDVFLMFIFAGGSEFSRKHILDFIEQARTRAETSTDSGIVGIAVVSDTTLPSVTNYYKYRGYFDVVQHASGYKLDNKKLDIWTKFKSDPQKSVCYMSPYDMGGIEPMLEKFEKRFRGEDMYISKIVVPDLSKSVG